MIEYSSVASTIIGADAAVKAAQIELIEIRLRVGMGARYFVTFTGDVSSVKKAVKAGTKVGKRKDCLRNQAVISAPNEKFYNHLF